MKQLKPAFTLLVAVLAAAVLGAAFWLRRPPEKPAPAPVRIGVQDNTACALLFVADRQGFLAAENIQASFQRHPSGKLALQALFAGEVDIATTADLPIVAASLDRDDFTILATIAVTDCGAWILARKDRGIAAPADLQGKAIGTQKDSAVHFFLSMFILRHRIPQNSVRIEFMAAADLPQALIDGRVDAISMRNPFIAQARESLGTNAVELLDPDIYRQTFNLVALRPYATKQRATFRRLLRALESAERLAAEDGTAAREATLAWLGPDRRAEVEDDWARYSFTLTLEQSLFLTMEDQARWAIDQSPDAGRRVPNYARFVEVRPLQEVKPSGVSIIR